MSEVTAGVRARHVTLGGGQCLVCQTPYPCDAIQLCDKLEAAEKEAARMRGVYDAAVAFAAFVQTLPIGIPRGSRSERQRYAAYLFDFMEAVRAPDAACEKEPEEPRYITRRIDGLVDGKEYHGEVIVRVDEDDRPPIDSDD